MKIGKQSRRDAAALFQACRSNGRFDEDRVRQAVSLLATRRPRGYAATLEHLHRLVKLDLERRAARVENAVESSPAQIDRIRATLEKKYGGGLDLTYWVNPALIGGLKVRVGSDIYDGSVAARLNSLAENL